MHYFTLGKDAVDSAIGPVLDQLARTILMIESGKQLFVNGVYTLGPHAPFLFKDLGHCKIQLYATSATIVVLLPGNSNNKLSRVIDRLVGHINTAIAKIQATFVGPMDKRVRRRINAIFSSQMTEYFPTPSNICREQQSYRVEERSFRDCTFSAPRASGECGFTWNITSTFGGLNEKGTSITTYVNDKTAICLDLISGRPLGYEEVKMPATFLDLVNLFSKPGPRPAVVNVSRGRIHHTANHPRINYIRASATVEIKSNDISKKSTILYRSSQPKRYIKAAPADDKSTLLGRVVEAKGEDDPDQVCQVCFKPLWCRTYAIERADGMVCVCAICATSIPTMADVVGLMPITTFIHPRTIDEVSESVFGLPTGVVPSLYAGRSEFVFVEGEWLVSQDTHHLHSRDALLEIVSYCAAREPANVKVLLID